MMDRPKFKELRYYEGMSIPEEYDIVQLKMDGMWGCMVMSCGEWNIYSRTGKLKASGHLDTYEKDETMILGEFMKNSHWAHRHGCDGHFYAFDCVKYKGQDLAEEPLAERLDTLNHYVLPNAVLGSGHSVVTPAYTQLHPLNIWHVSDWERLWGEYVVGEGYEGLVFKNSSSLYNDKNAWSRMKAIVEIDYICTGFRPADEGTKYEGLVGSVIGTLTDKEVFVTCGGLTEDMRDAFTKYPERYIGQVFTAKGNNWYPSGAIRHPMFVRWRDDKEVDECRYDQIPAGVRDL